MANIPDDEETAEVLRQLEAILRATGHPEILEGVRERLEGKTGEEHELLEWSDSQQIRMLLDELEATVELAAKLDDGLADDQLQAQEAGEVKTPWRVATPSASPLADPTKSRARRLEITELKDAIAALRSDFT